MWSDRLGNSMSFRDINSHVSKVSCLVSRVRSLFGEQKPGFFPAISGKLPTNSYETLFLAWFEGCERYFGETRNRVSLRNFCHQTNHLVETRFLTSFSGAIASSGRPLKPGILPNLSHRRNHLLETRFLTLF